MRAALAALPGVRHISVDFDRQQAVVTVERSALDAKRLIAALEEAGFGGKILHVEAVDAAGSASANDEKVPSENGSDRSGPPLPGLGEEGTKADTDGAGDTSAAFQQHVQVRAYLDHTVLRPGDAFRVAVVLDIETGWHIYGNPLGPGIGQPTVVSIAGPEGFEFEPARYAPAHRVEQDFGDAGKTWVWQHTGRVVHYLAGRVADTVKPGSYQWSVKVSGQVCTEKACVPGTVSVSLPVRIVEPGAPTEAVNQEWFKGFPAAKTPAENTPAS